MTFHDMRAEGLSLAYGDTTIVDSLDLRIPDGKITVIVGANASGKSTLLRGLVRLMKPSAGHVLLDGTAIDEQRSIDVAKLVALLPQSPVAPGASPSRTSSVADATRTRAGSAGGPNPTTTR